MSKKNYCDSSLLNDCEKCTMPPNENTKRCCAICDNSGGRCNRPATKDSNFCSQHSRERLETHSHYKKVCAVLKDTEKLAMAQVARNAGLRSDEKYSGDAEKLAYFNLVHKGPKDKNFTNYLADCIRLREKHTRDFFNNVWCPESTSASPLSRRTSPKSAGEDDTDSHLRFIKSLKQLQLDIRHKTVNYKPSVTATAAKRNKTRWPTSATAISAAAMPFSAAQTPRLAAQASRTNKGWSQLSFIDENSKSVAMSESEREAKINSIVNSPLITDAIREKAQNLYLSAFIQFTNDPNTIADENKDENDYEYLKATTNIDVYNLYDHNGVANVQRFYEMLHWSRPPPTNELTFTIYKTRANKNTYKEAIFYQARVAKSKSTIAELQEVMTQLNNDNDNTRVLPVDGPFEVFFKAFLALVLEQSLVEFVLTPSSTLDSKSSTMNQRLFTIYNNTFTRMYQRIKGNLKGSVRKQSIKLDPQNPVYAKLTPVYVKLTYENAVQEIRDTLTGVATQFDNNEIARNVVRNRMLILTRYFEPGHLILSDLLKMVGLRL